MAEPKKECRTCEHCGMEPDLIFYCVGVPGPHGYGVNLHGRPVEECGPEYKLWQLRKEG